MDKKRDTTENKQVEGQQSVAANRASARRKASFINADQFKQFLLKYSSRHAKSGRQFALISVEVANFETLTNYAGKDEVKHMMNSIRTVVADTSRDADRICAVPPAMLLVLLPETTLEGAEYAQARLQTSLSASVRPIAQIKPVHTFRLSASDEAAGDLQELLSAVGCMLDEHGDLKTIGRTRAAYKLGSVSSWLSRYKLAEEWHESPSPAEASINAQVTSGIDTWTGVSIKMIKVQLDSTGYSQQESCDAAAEVLLVQRARALQQLDNSSMQRMLDFFIDYGNDLYIALEDSTISPLTNFRANLSEGHLLAVALDFVGIVIQAQTLVPHMALTLQPEKLHFDQKQQQLQLIDYQLSYLFPELEPSQTDTLYMAALSEFLQYLTAGLKGRVAQELSELAVALNAPKRPEHLNTPHKVRTHLRKLSEKFHDLKNGKDKTDQESEARKDA
jgi:GGDEF domain-containing protein